MPFSLSVWRNRWTATEFPSLPALDAGEGELYADYCQLARGLASLLCRCSPRGAERHFPAALLGFRGLRRQLKRGRTPGLPAQLLSDLCHEIAQYTDAATLEAGVRCLRRHAAGPPAALPSSGLEEHSTVFASETLSPATRPLHRRPPGPRRPG